MTTRHIEEMTPEHVPRFVRYPGRHDDTTLVYMEVKAEPCSAWEIELLGYSRKLSVHLRGKSVPIFGHHSSEGIL